METSNNPTNFGLAVNSEKCLEFNVFNEDPNNKVLSSEPDEKQEDDAVSEDDSQNLQRSMFGLGEANNTYRSLDTGREANESSLLPKNELDITSQQC